MAITAAALQTALGTKMTDARVLRQDLSVSGGEVIGTKQRWYVDGRVAVAGRVRWCETTASDNAATQAAAVLTALRA